MGYAFSRRSMSRLETAHPALQALMVAAIADDPPCDMTILCGYRTEEDQNEAYQRGASKLKYPRSKHNIWPSHAVDVAPYIEGAVSWEWPDYWPLVEHIKATWERLPSSVTDGWRLVAGADWQSFPDGPHWQIEAV